MFDIVVAGEINPDLILTGDVTPSFGQVEKLVASATLTVGSSSVIFACGAARLGLRVAFIGLCGDDFFGHFMLEEMKQHQIDISHVILRLGQSTGLSVILNTGADRAILTYPGLMAALKAEDIPDILLSQARHLHVASYFLQTALQPGIPALFHRAHALGLSVSLDTNYDPTEIWSGFDKILPLIDVLLPNEQEALSLTHTSDMEAALNYLSGRSITVAVKLGAQGAVAQEASEIVVASPVTVNVVDTVGAGDTFDAGFLYGWLNHWSLKKSLELACACGSLSTRAAGGTTAQPTLAEALRYVSG